MNNLIKFSIIFTLMLFTQYKTKETEGSRYIKEKFDRGSFCIGETNYDFILSDTIAMKYYVDKICSQVPGSKAQKYITDNYGVKTKKMGEGSFGAVYKYVKGSEIFAIKVPSSFEYKVLFKEINGSECLKEKLKNDVELEQMAFVKECIKPSGKNPHLIMKFYSFTLEQNIFKHYPSGWTSLTNEQKGKLLKKMYLLTKELNAMHKAGLAHRDLKTENVMVAPGGAPILVDFGMLSPKGDLAKTFCGTPLYIDYEVINRNGKGLSSDVYSLLMTFVAMLNGKKANNFLDNILNRGGYDKAMRGEGSYAPKFADLHMPSELAWTVNMFIPTNSGRWKTSQVVTQFEKMLSIDPNQVQEVKKEASVAVIKDHPKPKIPQVVSEAQQIVDKLKKPSTKKAQPIASKPMNIKRNNYYNYERKVENPTTKKVLNLRKNRANFLEQNNHLDKLIEDAIKLRKDQKRIFEDRGYGVKAGAKKFITPMKFI